MTILWQERYTDAYRDYQLLVVKLERSLEIMEQPSAEFLDIRRTLNPNVQDDELVATEPSDRVALADIRLQPLADRAQETIADVVAEAVVDFLEAIEVDVQDSGETAARSNVVDRTIQALGQKNSVRQLGQRVMEGEEADAGLCVDLGRDIARRTPVPDVTPRSIPNRCARQPQRPLSAGAVHIGAHHYARALSRGIRRRQTTKS
jgi:hypothetical protein